jgi:hypothetical protein
MQSDVPHTGIKKYGFGCEALKCQMQECLSIVLWQSPTLHVGMLMLMSKSELRIWLLDLYPIVLARAVQSLELLSNRTESNPSKVQFNSIR